MGIAEATRSVLEPYVGSTVADTCVRATALSVGKTSEDLTAADLVAVSASIRRLLGPIAPAATIDTVIRALQHEMAVNQ